MLYIKVMLIQWSLDMSRKPSHQPIKVSRNRIIRSVASSSAIETGEKIEVIEKRLKNVTQNSTKVALAI